jgi:hypothetical protein
MHQILLDLSSASFVSSSGLVAIHSIALLLHGEQPPDLEQGGRPFTLWNVGWAPARSDISSCSTLSPKWIERWKRPA